MRNLLVTVLASSWFSLNTYAVLEVGDTVPNQCWNTESLAPVCLEFAPDTVRVLLFNAGWCGPCNSEFQELGPRTKEFDAEPVLFVSLSSDGWTKGTPPDAKFLGEWREKHGLSIPVAASPKDPGKAFFAPPLFIPCVAIVGRDGKLAYKAVNPGVDQIFAQIRKLVVRPSE